MYISAAGEIYISGGAHHAVSSLTYANYDRSEGQEALTFHCGVASYCSAKSAARAGAAVGPKTDPTASSPQRKSVLSAGHVLRPTWGLIVITEEMRYRVHSFN